MAFSQKPVKAINNIKILHCIPKNIPLILYPRTKTNNTKRNHGADSIKILKGFKINIKKK
tara:strand:+ start:459 stop:638 length:180 start_codon:yes stop_codon:yes gene_type:complete